ncbi:MAG: hypothetical protein K9K86_01735 [Pseudomonadales bacterium]|nr:hypothetical protein [Pseudomonadales bacterium]
MRFQEGTFGSSRLAYSVGAFAVSEELSTVWIAGHAHHYSVGAYELLEPKRSFSVSQLPIAANLQLFKKIRPGKKLSGEPNRITGMQLINNQLWVNVAEWYDADTDNNNTTMVFSDALDLQNSEQYGYFQLEGRAHAAGWISPIPTSKQTQLGGTHIAGFASNIPINSRLSMGPSLFTWNPDQHELTVSGSTIATNRLLDYTLPQPLHEDGYNEAGNNDMWTELSIAYVGFIPENSNHYLVIGSSGGHISGIGYKITQDNGRKCGGPCAYDHDDYYNYFWLYSLSDIELVRNGSLSPSSIRPIDYGVLPVYDGRLLGSPLMIGASYCDDSSRLYLLFDGVDKTQNKYEPQPALFVYKLSKRIAGEMNALEVGAGESESD